MERGIPNGHRPEHAGHEPSASVSARVDDWRGVLYPDGLSRRHWLERAEVFDTVD